MFWKPSEGSALRRRTCAAVTNANRTKSRWPETRLLALAKQKSWVMGDLGKPSFDGNRSLIRLLKEGNGGEGLGQQYRPILPERLL